MNRIRVLFQQSSRANEREVAVVGGETALNDLPPFITPKRMKLTPASDGPHVDGYE